MLCDRYQVDARKYLRRVLDGASCSGVCVCVSAPNKYRMVRDPRQTDTRPIPFVPVLDFRHQQSGRTLDLVIRRPVVHAWWNLSPPKCTFRDGAPRGLRPAMEGIAELEEFSRALTPDPAAPDSPVSTYEIIRALCSCPAVRSSATVLRLALGQ